MDKESRDSEAGKVTDGRRSGVKISNENIAKRLAAQASRSGTSAKR